MYRKVLSRYILSIAYTYGVDLSFAPPIFFEYLNMLDKIVHNDAAYSLMHKLYGLFEHQARNSRHENLFQLILN